MSDNESFHSVSEGEDEDSSIVDDHAAFANKLSSDLLQNEGGNNCVQIPEKVLKGEKQDNNGEDSGWATWNDDNAVICEGLSVDDVDANSQGHIVKMPEPADKKLDIVKKGEPGDKQLDIVSELEGWDDWDVDDLVTPQCELPPPIQRASVPRDQPRDVASLFDTQDRPATLWGGWNSLLTVASDSINTFTSSVGEGLHSVMETVETSIGVLSPEDLAKLSIEERAALELKADRVKEPLPANEIDDCDSAEEGLSDGGSDSGIIGGETSSGYQSDSARSDPHATPIAPSAGGLLSGVTSVFESTGKHIVSGGLDALETLGKRTFNALTEKNESTQRRRFILQQEKPNLSQVLKELQLKEQAESESFEEEKEARLSSFSHLFDKYQGMINLEALEMLSDNCRRQLPASLSEECQQQLNGLEEVFDQLLDDSRFSISEDEELDFEDVLKECVAKIDMPVNADTLILTHKKHRESVISISAEQNVGTLVNAKDINKSGMSCLAEFTAAGVQFLHKLSQLLLLSSHLPDANVILDVCHCLCTQVGICSADYTACLNTAADNCADSNLVNPLITALFLEASNSCNYIREACKLVLPIMKLRATQI